MKLGRLQFGLPLLAKELTEQAARRRTYVIRTIYAALFAFIASLTFISYAGATIRNPLAVLGQGREIFRVLVSIQFLGIYLFMPAITCGVLTAEKERNSLGLLLLTRMGPWAILFEKLAGRLVPMFTFLLLSLPVLAFAYALGGISWSSIVTAIWCLSITVLQAGTIALFCSAFFRTTPSALIACYLLGLVLIFGPVFLQVWEVVRFDRIALQVLVGLGYAPSYSFSQEVCLLLVGAFVFMLTEQGTLSSVLPASIPILLWICFFLVLARVFVVRRAFLEPQGRLLKLFRHLDRVFTKINQNRLTRGVVLIRDQSSLPLDEPVAWRETTRKSLGTVRYLVRTLLLFELPVIALCLLVGSFREYTGFLSGVLLFLWIVALLVVTVAATNLIAGERARQSFDVLLTTPLSGRELIEQKFRGIKRLIIATSVPFVTIIGFEIAVRSAYTSSSRYDFPRGFDGFGDTLLYAVCSLLTLAVYLPLVAWMSFYIGLKVRSQGKAIVASLATVFMWTLFPFLALLPWVIVYSTLIWPGRGDDGSVYSIDLLSPSFMVVINEFGIWSDWKINHPVHQVLQVVVHFALQGMLLFALRYRCLNYADKLLRRE